MWTGEENWYVEYKGGEKEIYDVGADPSLPAREPGGTLPEAEAALCARLESLKTCVRNSCRLAEDGSK